jgi:CubicO group peptidase (beta-lactamase class C family)
VLVDGTFTDDFAAVRDAFGQTQANDEGAAQLAVYHRGRLVVDLWTAQTTPGRTPFARDSISLLMSATKALTSTCAHYLVQRGYLDLDAPVASYWRQFGANGKGQITTRHLLTHSAGLVAFSADANIGARDLLDWDRCITALAGMAPLWQPGSAFAYHALTFGYLVGEVVRRIDGRSVGRFFAEEIANPLGLDLWIGLPEAQEHRVVDQFVVERDATREPAADQLQASCLAIHDPIIAAMLANAALMDEGMGLLNTRAGRAAEMPAGNGIGDAVSLAKLYAALLGEDIEGLRLFNADTFERVRHPLTDGMVQVGPWAGVSPGLRFGLGYEASRVGVPMLGGFCFGHSGAGGRLGFADPATGTAVGYTCTNMRWDFTAGPDPRWLPWTAALRDVVGR